MKKILIPLTFLLGFSCVEQRVEGPNPNDAVIEVPSEFNFNTITPESIKVTLLAPDGSPMAGVKVAFYDQSPITGGQVFLKIVTDRNGIALADYSLPASLETAVLEINTIGFPGYLGLTIDELKEDILIQGFEHKYRELSLNQVPNASYPEDGTYVDGFSNGRIAATSYKALGKYDSNGVPKYLEPKRDVITSEILSFISASLPEAKPVPTYHPQFLSANAQSNLVIEKTADIWMTFVHEGAGYKNVLGFYTYPTNSPPKTVSDIQTIFVAFPNASFNGSGGGLTSGDKVNLGRFEPGQTMGFVLLADGWRNGTITGGVRQVYSNEYLNPETNNDLQAHNVLLWDETNKLFLIGFEDLNRMEGSDEDFNDAVFYITANPVEAISTTNVNPIDKPLDTDGDGVNDTYDEFPNDPALAYRYSYPGENSFGTFAFEDNWPGYGDYDFNDFVVDYQYDQYANATNKMVQLKSTFIIKAIGAGFSNGFGVQLDALPTSIESVTGSQLSTELFNLTSNGVEANQQKSVILISDDVHRNFGTRGFVNTSTEFPNLTPDTIRVTVSFKTPMALSGAGSAPFNPFLVINQTRGREVHLPGYKPTDLVDQSYFGQGNDATDLSKDSYYKSQTGLPWAMNLPVSFDYPKEKTKIQDAYVFFPQWANSGGYSYMDWYTNKPGYRNTEKLYTR